MLLDIPANDNQSLFWDPLFDEPWDRPFQFTSGREVSAGAVTPIAAPAYQTQSGGSPVPGHLGGEAVPPFSLTAPSHPCHDSRSDVAECDGFWARVSTFVHNPLANAEALDNHEAR